MSRLAWTDPAPLEVERPRLPWWTMLPPKLLLATSPVIVMVVLSMVLVFAARRVWRYPLFLIGATILTGPSTAGAAACLTVPASGQGGHHAVMDRVFLSVDAIGVDLQQHRYVANGPRTTSVAGTPHQDAFVGPCLMLTF